MAFAAESPDKSIAEYLEEERASGLRHEYIGGRVVAMGGSSRQHNRIVRNLLVALDAALRGTGTCEVYASDLRVRVAETGLYTYPDLVVACGEARFEDDELDTLLDPIVLVEVLSPSTEAWDRGGKWERYRAIPTLREYLLVSQDRILVERYWRPEETDVWSFSESSEAGRLKLASLECELELSAIYRQVELQRHPSEGDRAATGSPHPSSLTPPAVKPRP